MEQILKVENLKKYFKVTAGLLHAVDDVSFSIDAGETLGVVGESGCGKSTLGHVIIHLEKPTDGKILFEGKDVSNPGYLEKRRLRKDVQFIFQDPYSSLNPRMTVQRIIIEPLLIAGVEKTKAAERVNQLMDMVGLAQRVARTYPHELDGGRRQRVGVARALALNPKLIICDEPVSALDVSIQAQILNLMQDLQDQLGLTYIFITHNLSVVKHISDNIIVMYLGKVVEHSTTERLFANPLHPYTKALISAIPTIDLDAMEPQTILQGEIASPINPAIGCRFSVRCPHVSDICKTQTPELAEYEPGHRIACHRLDEI